MIKHKDVWDVLPVLWSNVAHKNHAVHDNTITSPMQTNATHACHNTWNNVQAAQR